MGTLFGGTAILSGQPPTTALQSCSQIIRPALVTASHLYVAS